MPLFQFWNLPLSLIHSLCWLWTWVPVSDEFPSLLKNLDQCKAPLGTPWLPWKKKTYTETGILNTNRTMTVLLLKRKRQPFKHIYCYHPNLSFSTKNGIFQFLMLCNCWFCCCSSVWFFKAIPEMSSMNEKQHSTSHQCLQCSWQRGRNFVSRAEFVTWADICVQQFPFISFFMKLVTNKWYKHVYIQNWWAVHQKNNLFKKSSNVQSSFPQTDCIRRTTSYREEINIFKQILLSILQ